MQREAVPDSVRKNQPSQLVGLGVARRDISDLVVVREKDAVQ